MDTMQTEERNTVPRNNVTGVDKEVPEETEHKDSSVKPCYAMLLIS